ncbi:hypothetical protein EXS66_01570 [Candidatus Saccharibacteria bacterium]|nr:hypothetical protein [Candidatus Saccharibacteria bacterium]
MVKIYSARTCLGSFNKGTELAPKEILGRSLMSGLAKNAIQSQLGATEELLRADKGDAVNAHYRSALVEFNKSLYKKIIKSTSSTDIALTLGGDHAISIATMFATKKRHSDCVVVYIDAHPDCNEPQSSPTGNIHGMPLATVLGDSLYSDFKLPKYRYDEVFMMGIKDADKFERRYIKKNNILCVLMDEIIEKGIAAALKKIKQQISGRPVHVSLDIDSIDVSEAPGTGIINKGGLSYREVSYLCRNLAQEKIVAIDLVEVNPTRDIADKTINLSAELIINLLGGQWSVYDRYLDAKH